MPSNKLVVLAGRERAARLTPAQLAVAGSGTNSCLLPPSSYGCILITDTLYSRTSWLHHYESMNTITGLRFYSLLPATCFCGVLGLVTSLGISTAAAPSCTNWYVPCSLQLLVFCTRILNMLSGAIVMGSTLCALCPQTSCHHFHRDRCVLWTPFLALLLQ